MTIGAGYVFIVNESDPCNICEEYRMDEKRDTRNGFYYLLVCVTVQESLVLELRICMEAVTLPGVHNVQFNLLLLLLFIKLLFNMLFIMNLTRLFPNHSYYIQSFPSSARTKG